jgi:SAM-dependent methyltransferase
MSNPWLSIPLADYEAHMASDTVRQRQMLDQVFGSILDLHQPGSLAVLGCSGGEGLEKLEGRRLERVVAVDINPDYLQTLAQRFGASIPKLQTVCADVADPELDLPKVDLVYAALIFEHLEPARLIANIRRWLAPKGVATAVLQLPADGKDPVTPTPFQSLRALAPAMKLVPPDALRARARASGLEEVASESVVLDSGKSFLICTFRQNCR